METRTYDDTMFRDTFEHEYTWTNGVMRNVQRFGSKLAIIDPELDKTWTYEQLNKDVNKLSNTLQKAGVEKGDVVMGALRNSPEFAFSYIAPRKIGGIFLAANYNLSAGEMALLINHNKPKVVIYSGVVAQMMSEAAMLCLWKPACFVMADNPEGAEIPEGHISYEKFVEKASDTEPVINFRRHIYDEAVRLCTSGTTAIPKSVPLNEINEVLSAHDVIMHYPMNNNDITMNMTPWFHRGGCHSGGICPTFYAGGAVVVMRYFKPRVTLEWIGKYKITFIMGAPASLEVLCRSQGKDNYNLSSLRGIVTMGAPLSKENCIRFMEYLSPNIFNGYGTTETFWNCFLKPSDLPENAGAVGRSCTDDEVRVVKMYEDKKADPDEVVPMDGTTEGEIIIRSPAKSTYTYYNNPDAAEQKFYKGWMYTADAGVWNKDSIVTVTGRKDDMMVVSGENIYPAQVEDAINSFPKVRDSLVTSVPDSVRGQSVVAYVIADDPSLTIKELMNECNDCKVLSRYKKPRYFAIVDKFPMTATGKKRHGEMKKRAPEDVKNGVLRKD